jgi:hypothetical protein
VSIEDDDMPVSLFAMSEPIRHEIKAPHNLLQVEPPLEHARLRLTAELDAWLGAVCQLPRLKYTWGDNGDEEKPTSGADTFRAVLHKIAASDLAKCYERVEDKIKSASSYVSTWLEYQALWDIDVETVCNSLGSDLKKWEKVLLDMKRSRATFDTASAHVPLFFPPTTTTIIIISLYYYFFHTNHFCGSIHVLMHTSRYSYWL